MEKFLVSLKPYKNYGTFNKDIFIYIHRQF